MNNESSAVAVYFDPLDNSANKTGSWSFTVSYSNFTHNLFLGLIFTFAEQNLFQTNLYLDSLFLSHNVLANLVIYSYTTLFNVYANNVNASYGLAGLEIQYDVLDATFSSTSYIYISDSIILNNQVVGITFSANLITSVLYCISIPHSFNAMQENMAVLCV